MVRARDAQFRAIWVNRFVGRQPVHLVMYFRHKPV